MQSRLKIAQVQQRILSLEADNMRLQVELQHHETRRLSVDFIRHDPKQCIYYTGLPEFAVFEVKQYKIFLHLGHPRCNTGPAVERVTG